MAESQAILISLYMHVFSKTLVSTKQQTRQDATIISLKNIFVEMYNLIIMIVTVGALVKMASSLARRQTEKEYGTSFSY